MAKKIIIYFWVVYKMVIIAREEGEAGKGMGVRRECKNFREGTKRSLTEKVTAEERPEREGTHACSCVGEEYSKKLKEKVQRPRSRACLSHVCFLS
jgi:hypothetical protein